MNVLPNTDAFVTSAHNINFQNGEIINDYEAFILELIEMLLGDRYRCWGQIPLGVICARPDDVPYLPTDLFKFWANSRVDIALLEKRIGVSRKAKLVIECQSHWHDTHEAQIRDRLKSQLLQSAGIPLIYVRRVDTDSRFYRFFTPDQSQEVLYNIITQAGKDELNEFLCQFL
ncbi:hypothetical protein AWQ21_10825 [Picosynechococcus sp. PCC 7003]|uniref:DUF2726 domain-containing protein n=1 Tax=Picosynechococcus sp. PCC 7003 TaxID=374981 RepID=UPI000810771C|nr:DUF2726 domain-containing protein [Picosynechococcus sp. PCC 7003]ANV84827.1 hypothetical protein AWQ21_10825 [Picosynechococcus sp. PCC 7003]